MAMSTRESLSSFSPSTVKMISEKDWLTFTTGRNALKWSDLTTVATLLFAAYLGYWIYGYIQVRMQVRGLPAIHSFIEFFESGARSKLPHIPFFAPVNDYTLNRPFKKYEIARSDLIALTQVTTSHPVYITASPTVAHLISNKTSTFLKPTKMFRYQAINILGLQIVSAQTGPEHRRHKNVAKGCFNEKIMKAGWDKTVDALEVMIKEEGLEQGGMMKNVKTCMIKLTLNIICATGFGVSVPWNIPHTDGPTLPFFEALDTVETTMIPQLLLPLWLMKYSPFAYFQRCAKAQTSLIEEIKSMIASRRAALMVERASLDVNKGEKVKPPSDILGALVASQMEVEDEARLVKGDGKIVGLADKEILGNTFIFIVAGHETTGHTLTWVLGYLALHPEVQERVYREIIRVCGDQPPTYRDMNGLSYTLATIYESLRLRDLVMTLPKVAAEDFLLPYTTWDSSGSITNRTKLIKKGSHVIIDSPACQRNPQFWVDPEKFDPSRHLGEKGAVRGNGYTGFSMGTRQCIGKRFAEVEMVALVSTLVRRYKIYPVPLEGESFEENKKRYEKGNEELSFTPDDWDLRLERRVHDDDGAVYI